MWNNFVGNQIRRTNCNLLVNNLLLLAAIIGIGALNVRYFANFFHGPEPISPKTLSALKDPDTLKQYCVSVQGEKSLPIGSKYEVRHGNKRATESYLLLKVGNRLLLVETMADITEESTSFDGSLTHITPEVQTKLLDEAFSDEPKLKQLLLPYMLEATDFRVLGNIGLALGVPLFGVGIYNLLRAGWRIGNCNSYPAAKVLAAYGTPSSVADGIDAEVKMQGEVIGPVTLTPNWLLRSAKYRLDVLRLEEIVWAYQKVTQHYTNFIPTGKTFAAMLCDRNGKTLEIQGRKDIIAAVIIGIARRQPWILVGFDEQLAKAYKSDRAGMVAAVDARRSQQMAQAAQPPQFDLPFSTGPKHGFPSV